MRYLTYAELSEKLTALAERFSDWMTLESIGRTPEGRDILAVALSAHGPRAGERPGILVDGNTHAGEVTGSAAALHLVEKTATAAAAGEAWARALLDRRTLYVVPRLSVDGAETYLTTPYLLRSVARPYPDLLEPEGFQQEDVDGDGRILRMRIRHPAGDFRPSERDPRVMVRRRPGETGPGPFYRLLPEGRWLPGRLGHGFPGYLREGRPRWGLDFNRNYPAQWKPEGEQRGAGRMPLSEPETRALADFVLAHPNIGLYVSLHTTGGILLRPPSFGDDSAMIPDDLYLFEALGRLGTETLGYPCASTYETFRDVDRRPVVKGADDWLYEHLGAVAFTLELWDLYGHAGRQGYAQRMVTGMDRRSFEEEEADELALMRFVDEELGGEGFHPWRPFEHPDLGLVEIGGFDRKFLLQNPPPGRFLAEEAEKVHRFVTRLAWTAPELVVSRAEAEALADGLYRVTAVVENHGYLGTATTAQAVRMRSVPEVAVELTGDVRVVEGALRQEIGQLDGYGRTRADSWGVRAVDRAVSWVVAAAPGTEVTVTASHPRAGVARRGLRLPVLPDVLS